MKVWKRAIPPEEFSAKHLNTLPGLLGIRLVEVGDDFARATMPVDERHIQPAGILHGGASVVLAETLGSYCGVMALEAVPICTNVPVAVPVSVMLADAVDAPTLLPVAVPVSVIAPVAVPVRTLAAAL